MVPGESGEQILPTERLMQFYVGGRWVAALSGDTIEVIDPSNEQVTALIASAGPADVDSAVSAARAAFDDWSRSTIAERIDLLAAIEAGFHKHREALCRAMSREMGVPIAAAQSIHFGSGPAHLQEAIKILRTFEFETLKGSTLIIREPIGVCALITPWNFPINQVACKIAPAIAAGCTMVLKPSEVSPLSALIIAEIFHEAGAPAGVFNLVNGDGAGTGQYLVSHPDVDMVSFTGSTRAGIAIAKAAAHTIKRVGQELGGKSPNILLPDVDLERAVALGVARCMNNSGQSCVAPTRMLVPSGRLSEVRTIARKTAEALRVGSAYDPATQLGPVAHRAQFDKVQALIQSGLEQGAHLVTGGLGRPLGMTCGWFVRPTIFSNVNNGMQIAREEIFGPVLSIIAYQDVDEAVQIANDTPYGLGAYVQGRDAHLVRDVARRLRVGNVQLNYPPVDRGAPFGGYKRSGNGREWGEFGLLEYLEVKAVVGWESINP